MKTTLKEHPRIVFVGAHVEAKRPLEFLIQTRENLTGIVTLHPEARARISGGVDLRSLADEAGIAVRECSNINDRAEVEWITERSPDILLVIGWTQLLKAELLRVPRIAALGFHASLLPKYRGRAPINWALINGERETGNTMIVLEPGADEGDIVLQRRILITPEDDCSTLYEKVSETECDMLAHVLPLIRRHSLPRQKQNPAEATLMTKRRPEDGLIHWSRPAEDLHNWVRALTHPYPGAFSFLNSRKVWIWKSSLACNQESLLLAPGEVGVNHEGFPVVGTGRGLLKLLKVQIEGESEVSGLEAGRCFLRAHSLLEAREAVRR